MKNKFSTLLIVLIAMSCNAPEQKKEVTVEPIPVEQMQLSDSTEFYRIAAAYPLDPGDRDSIMPRIINKLVEDKKEEWKTGGEAYLNEQKLTHEMPDRSMPRYELNIAYEAIESARYQSRSYLFRIFEYTGGANGNTRVMSFNYDADGRLTLEDILQTQDGKDIALSRLLADQALKDHPDFNEEMLMDGLGLSYLKEDGLTLDKEKCKCDGFLFASNLQHFVLLDEGIRFYFDKYQIAPGAFGTPVVLISWKQLEPFLNAPFKQ
jgi:hypothetical protein